MQLGFHGIAHIERVDKLRDALGRDSRVGAGELLERLVGVGIAFAAQDGLDALGHDVPHTVEIGL